MDRIIKWLNRPYPFDGTWANHFRNAGRGGLFVALFLIIFRPFGMQISDDVFWYAMLVLAGFGLITAVGLLLVGLVIEMVPTFFNEKDWTAGREIITNLFGILIIAIANMCYSVVIWDNGFSWPLFFHWIWVTFLVGLGPILITVFIKQNLLDRRHHKGAEKLNTQLKIHEPDLKTDLILSGENQGESLSVHPGDLLYLEASDNYVRVFYQSNGLPSEKGEAVENTLLRSSLKKMESQLSDLPQFFRCHRTYLVNLDRVEHVSGNAQGYKLHLSGTESLVPVSRSLNAEIDKRLS